MTPKNSEQVATGVMYRSCDGCGYRPTLGMNGNGDLTLACSCTEVIIEEEVWTDG